MHAQNKKGLEFKNHTNNTDNSDYEPPDPTGRYPPHEIIIHRVSADRPNQWSLLYVDCLDSFAVQYNRFIRNRNASLHMYALRINSHCVSILGSTNYPCRSQQMSELWDLHHYYKVESTDPTLAKQLTIVLVLKLYVHVLVPCTPYLDI